MPSIRCPRARLNVVELEARNAPAIFTVTLRGSDDSGNDAGEPGDTGADHAGTLTTHDGHQVGQGAVALDATSAANAVVLGLTGTVTVTVDGDSWDYTFGPDTVGTSPDEHKPFLLTISPGDNRATILFEDMAGRDGCDYDYNDRSWTTVSVADNPDDQGLIDAGHAVLDNGWGETADVWWSVRWTGSAADKHHWKYVVRNNNVREGIDENKGVVHFDAGGSTSGLTNSYTSLNGWVCDSGYAGWTALSADNGLKRGQIGEFGYDIEPRPIAPVPAQAFGGAHPVSTSVGMVKGPDDLKITILNAAEEVTDFAEVSRWQGAFTGPGSTASKDFYKTDSQRVYVRIEDSTRKGQGMQPATIKALLRTVDIEGDQADIVRNFDHKERQASSGVFYSEPFVLVSNKVDDEFQAANVADGSPKDPTLTVFKREKMTAKPLSILVGGKLEARYDPVTGIAPAKDDGGAVGRVNVGKDIKKVRVRPIILKSTSDAAGQQIIATSEVLEDFALMNVAWAQANIRVVPTSDPIVANPPQAEPYQDVGYLKDGNPAFGAGNGKFDWTDTNGDGMHQIGEPSEPFTNSNSNKGYDHLSVDPSNIPETGEGNKIFPMTRNLVDSLADNNDKTVDYIVINDFTTNYRGFSYHTAYAPAPRDLTRLNVMLIRAKSNLGTPPTISGSVGIKDNGEPRDFIAAAHELGHVIMNTLHVATPSTNIMFSLPSDVDTENATKRLSLGQVDAARNFAEAL